MNANSFFSMIKSLFRSSTNKLPTVPETEESDAAPEKTQPKEDIEVKENGRKDAPEKSKVKKDPDHVVVKDVINHVIEPEERTLKNFLSLNFWREKKDEVKKFQSKEKQDLNVYRTLSEGARPSIEYYVLTSLSCIIATTGLLQGSTAVIIGAMIVAPLMTPILGFSLSVIWGDFKLMKTSFLSIILGTFVAIAISTMIAYLIPLPGHSQEILSRTNPTLFDIVIAIASGIVGAYGYANKKISSSLVGIAIAVALMPPLCVIGIGLGSFNKSIATGATVLFLINLISMSLAGAAVFWAMKIHPILADEDEVKSRALYQIALSLAILIAIAIPTGIYMVEGYRVSLSKRILRNIIEKNIPENSIMRMDTVNTDSGLIVTITLSGCTIPDLDKIKEVKAIAQQTRKDIRKIKINFIQSMELLE